MDVRASVREYYGEILKSTQDLQTNACCTEASLPAHLRPLLANVHEEVLSRYYGCGIVVPEALAGCRILDLGCGTGRDCYVLAQLVGEHGEVIGLDMTEEQLAVARRHEACHSERFGYGQPNTRFLTGYIEELDQLDIEPGSIDVIVSNCVLNLSPDKAAVLRGAHRLLKSGGEMYFSDVYADRRVPPSISEDPVLYGECLGGALYWGDFVRLARAAGFNDPRLVESRPLAPQNESIAERIAGIKFYSATWRLFRIDGLEDACEDYGQAVVYKGSIDGHESSFALDSHHRIDSGRVFPVCGNTWRMLAESRFAEHFEFIGNWSKHYGIFPGCGTVCPFEDTGSGAPGSC